MSSLSRSAFLSMVDHTLLRPEASEEDVRRTAREGRAWGTASVCVHSMWVPAVRDVLAGSAVATCCVIGFPLGSMLPRALAAEAAASVEAGADELDMVVPVGLLREGARDRAGSVGSAARNRVLAHLGAVRGAAPGRVLKVILETALLSEGEIDLGCALAEQAGADFVKTSTGFNAAGGATVAAVRRMRDRVGHRLGVKASGGLRTLADAEAMAGAGASRLGMSSTGAVVAELAERTG